MIRTLYRHSLRHVSGSGVIVLVLVGMWALVLVPMWLRRHDQAQEVKSVNRFATAMSSLRGSADLGRLTRRDVVMPGRSREEREQRIMVSGVDESTVSTAAARRQRTLMVLGGFFVLMLVLRVLHMVPTWSLAVPVLLIAGFVVIARRQVAAAAELKRRREVRANLSEASRVAASRYEGAPRGTRRGGRVVEPAPMSHQDTVAIARENAVIQAATGTDSWHAVPTTLPTYVTAPRATAVPRVIDLRSPGAWSGAEMVKQARESLAPQSVADGEMRIETFEIVVPRDAAPTAPQTQSRSTSEPVVRQGPSRRQSSYAEQYVDDALGFDGLSDEGELEALLTDPRTGVRLPTYRRAANG